MQTFWTAVRRFWLPNKSTKNPVQKHKQYGIVSPDCPQEIWQLHRNLQEQKAACKIICILSSSSIWTDVMLFATLHMRWQGLSKFSPFRRVCAGKGCQILPPAPLRMPRQGLSKFSLLRLCVCAGKGCQSFPLSSLRMLPRAIKVFPFSVYALARAVRFSPFRLCVCCQGQSKFPPLRLCVCAGKGCQSSLLCAAAYALARAVRFCPLRLSACLGKGCQSFPLCATAYALGRAVKVFHFASLRMRR